MTSFFSIDTLKLTKLLIIVILGTMSSCIFEKPLIDQVFSEEDDQHWRGAQISFLFKDLSSGEVLEEYQSEKLMIPASNIKLFTLHSILKVYPDSLPAGCFYENKDSLIYIPTGNPTFLNEELTSPPVLGRLKNNSLSEVFVAIPPFDDQIYGPGWAWDDDGALFQCGRYPLSIYGGQISVQKEVNGGVRVPGVLFDDSFVFEPGSDQTKLTQIQLEKKPFSNELSLNRKINKNDAFQLEFSFYPTAELVLDLLADTLNKSVTRSFYLAENKDLECYYQASENIIRKMMHESDNFIAEQFMMMIGFASQKVHSVDKGIKFSTENFFREFNLTETEWVDGSGLSRYNRTNAQSLVNLLELLIEDNDLESIRSYLPQGGKEGTLANYYWDQDAYVWAKTGTMRGVYCLSGLLKSLEGKDIAFSIMVNNFRDNHQAVIKKVEQMLKQVRDEN